MTTAVNDTEAEVEPNVAGGRRQMRRPFVILAVLASLVLLGYFGFHWLVAGKENTDDAQVSADIVPIATRVGGTVLEVPVVDNQAVKKGDLLARIDPADYDAKLKQAEAERDAAKAQAQIADSQVQIVQASAKGGLGAARAALTGTTSSVAEADARIAAAKAGVTRAKTDADKADADLKRAETLRKTGAIAQAELDSIRASADSARAGLAHTKAELTAAEDSKRTAQAHIAEAEGRVEQSTPVDAQVAAAKANADLARARLAGAEAALTQAQLNLANTKIFAPEDGHISKLGVHPGQLVAVSQVITNVVPNTTYVVANFKETQVGSMRVGQDATIELDAFPGRKFRARVESIAFGTGAQFSLLPPDNASGNFVKVVQRVPVKLAWTQLPDDVRPGAGLSADVTVRVK